MNIEIKKILEQHKMGKVSTNKAVNKILLLSVVIKNEVSICEICNKHILINSTCPKCTIDLCTPLDGQIVL